MKGKMIWGVVVFSLLICSARAEERRASKDVLSPTKETILLLTFDGNNPQNEMHHGKPLSISDNRIKGVTEIISATYAKLSVEIATSKEREFDSPNHFDRIHGPKIKNTPKDPKTTLPACYKKSLSLQSSDGRSEGLLVKSSQGLSPSGNFTLEVAWYADLPASPTEFSGNIFKVGNKEIQIQTLFSSEWPGSGQGGKGELPQYTLRLLGEQEKIRSKGKVIILPVTYTLQLAVWRYSNGATDYDHVEKTLSREDLFKDEKPVLQHTAMVYFGAPRKFISPFPVRVNGKRLRPGSPPDEKHRLEPEDFTFFDGENAPRPVDVIRPLPDGRTTIDVSNRIQLYHNREFVKEIYPVNNDPLNLYPVSLFGVFRGSVANRNAERRLAFGIANHFDQIARLSEQDQRGLNGGIAAISLTLKALAFHDLEAENPSVNGQRFTDFVLP